MALYYLIFIVLFFSFGYANEYELLEDYKPNDFSEKFSFYIKPKPGDDFVNYVDKETAIQTGLFKVENNRVYMGVDYQNQSSTAGRNAIRLESKRSYTHGLFVLDLSHIPDNVCGTWPAFWLTSDNWPKDGEIDVIEGVNTQKFNLMTLHTGPNCSITKSKDYTGILFTSDCYINSPKQGPNQGCSISSDSANSYGRKFNEIGGGVYVLEWTADLIQIWMFERSAIPKDIQEGQPNPKSWSLPVAKYTNQACDIENDFRNQKIIFNINFCGPWAEGRWIFECLKTGKMCKDYVKDTPGVFRDVYWEVNSLKVYEKKGINRTKP